MKDGKTSKKTVAIVAALILGAFTFAATSQVNHIFTFGSNMFGFGPGYTPVSLTPSVVPVTDGSKVITLFGLCDTAGPYTTLREVGTVVPYNPPATGFMAMDMYFSNNAGSTFLQYLGWSTADAGLANAASPAGYQRVYFGQTGASLQTRDAQKIKYPTGTFVTAECYPAGGTEGYVLVTGVEL